MNSYDDDDGHTTKQTLPSMILKFAREYLNKRGTRQQRDLPPQGMPVLAANRAFAMLKSVLTVCEPGIVSGGRLDIKAMVCQFNTITGTGRRDTSKYEGNFRDDVFYHILMMNNTKAEWVWAILRYGFVEWDQGGRVAVMWPGKEFLICLRWKVCRDAREAEFHMLEYFTVAEVEHVKTKVASTTLGSDHGARVKILREKMNGKWQQAFLDRPELWTSSHMDVSASL